MRHRKHLRLHSNLYRKNGYFFVTSVSRLRLDLFAGVGRELVQRVLDGLPERFPSWAVDTTEIMPNHVHLVLKCTVTESRHSLGEVVGAFKSLVCREFRLNQGVRETVWQGNYYERIIRNEFELFAVREYIKRNPEAENFNWDDVMAEYRKFVKA